MSIKNNVKLIEEILASLDNPYSEKNLRLMRELGYLIGLLARMANNDGQVYKTLKAELEKLKNKH